MPKRIRDPAKMREYTKRSREKLKLENPTKYAEITEKERKRMRDKYQNDPIYRGKCKAYAKKKRAENPDEYRKKSNARNIKSYHKNLEKSREKGILKNREIKTKAMQKYGGKCECCGESRLQMLTMDHIHENGAKVRREEGVGKGTKFYIYLLKNARRDDIRILCHNCNTALFQYGRCHPKIINMLDEHGVPIELTKRKTNVTKCTGV